MIVTCDRCGKDISKEDYNTLNLRRYDRTTPTCPSGKPYHKVASIWLCDECFPKLIKYLKITPYYTDSDEVDD